MALSNKMVRLFQLASVMLLSTSLLLSGPVAASAGAEQKTLTAGAGWYWNRPDSPPPDQLALIGDPLSQNSPKFFKENHLYVGWNAATTSDPREMITGLAFDLFGLGVPPKATITKFVVSALEHPTGGDENTVNTLEAGTQGIIACPWPNFYNGYPAVALSKAPQNSQNKPGGDCGVSKVLATRPLKPVNPDQIDTTKQLFEWKFDVTSIMNKLWQNDDNPAISLEPNPDSNVAKDGWVTTFHSSAYTEPSPTDPFAKNPAPGVWAVIAWDPPAPDVLSSGSGDEVLTSIVGGGPSGGSEFVPTADSSSGVIDTPPPPTEGAKAPPVLTEASGFEPKPVAFWKGTFAAGLAGLLLLALVIGSGALLASEPEEEQRPKGAVDALMQGRQQTGGAA